MLEPRHGDSRVCHQAVSKRLPRRDRRPRSTLTIGPRGARRPGKEVTAVPRSEEKDKRTVNAPYERGGPWLDRPPPREKRRILAPMAGAQEGGAPPSQSEFFARSEMLRRQQLREDARRPGGELLEQAMRLSRFATELAAAGPARGDERGPAARSLPSRSADGGARRRGGALHPDRWPCRRRQRGRSSDPRHGHRAGP
jgi:hypothetical protein